MHFKHAFDCDHLMMFNNKMNINSLTDCQILQDDRNSLTQWEIGWRMELNVAKCYSMRVTE